MAFHIDRAVAAYSNGRFYIRYRAFTPFGLLILELFSFVVGEDGKTGLFAPVISPATKSFLTSAAVLFGICQASAQVTVYTDQSSFNTAVQAIGGLVSNSEDFNSGSKIGGVITTDFFTVSGSILGFPNTNSTTTSDGTAHLRLSEGEASFEMAAPVTALGFQLNPHSSAVGWTLDFTLEPETGSSIGGSFSTPATDVTGFRGFISTVPFTVFSASTREGDRGLWGVDNLVAYSAVPEPSAFATIVGVVVWSLVALRRPRRTLISSISPSRRDPNL
jgi:hypothetical protein